MGGVGVQYDPNKPMVAAFRDVVAILISPLLIMRRLSLHASALNDAEYDLYTSSLNDLAESNINNESNKSYDDLYYESLKVGIREARAWFRGRYSHVLVSDIDSVCSFI